MTLQMYAAPKQPQAFGWIPGFFIMMRSVKAFVRDESGVTAIEYGILAASMAAAIAVIFSQDGVFVKALNTRFQQIADQITKTGGTASSSKPQ